MVFSLEKINKSIVRPEVIHVHGITRTELHAYFGMRTTYSALQGKMTSVFLHFAKMYIRPISILKGCQS